MSELVLDSGLVAFRPRARLLKLIGSELISDEVLAVTELVKNAHDADASTVRVEFRGVTGPDGEIIIEDDGHGMDVETLLGAWMSPAGTTKAGGDGRFTGAGRRMLGEKGVGRFAADKLGRTLELRSRRAGQRGEIRASFDWDEFDSDSLYLSDIRCQWESRRSTTIEPHGTRLRIAGLRAKWTERLFRRLSTRLSRLRSPFGDRAGFTIYIDSDEFPQYAGEQRQAVLDRAPYRIEADFDGHVGIDVSLNGERPIRHPWTGPGDLQCGPVRVRLFSFDLEADALARVGPRTEVRAWLREWSGISVYRDAFRVWPYGEPHDDWLRLDQRRVNNPVVRLSNNQVVGFVEISRDRNPELVDQTNREGLIHNRALEDLRKLMYSVLQVLEAHRQSVRHPAAPRLAPRPESRNGHNGIPDALLRLASKAGGEMAQELRRLAERAVSAAEKERGQNKRLVDGLAGLAAVGGATSIATSILASRLERVRADLADLPSQLGHGVPTEVAAIVRAAQDETAAVVARLRGLDIAGGGVSQRKRTVHVPSEIERFAEELQPALEERGVRIHVAPRDVELLRAEIRPEVLHQVLQILAANSLDWLTSAPDPKISISVAARDGHCDILFADNGRGIDERHQEDVFEPQFSTKENGRGMGLTVARQIVEAHGGSIRVVVDGRRRGAALKLSLPRKRSRATVQG